MSGDHNMYASGNQSAFPVQLAEYRVNEGMTLRDYFAAKAMEGFLVCDVKYASDADMIARDAYVMADAMLKARDA